MQQKLLSYLMACVIITALVPLSISAQSASKEPPRGEIFGKFGEGLNYIAKDSSWSVRFRLRVQTTGEYIFADDRTPSGNTQIKRGRMRIDGHMFDPSLRYRLQLNFTNRDMESNRDTALDNPGILRDAVVEWTFAPGTQLWLGQTKLPGNRQRVVSSANQEFVDRSFANAQFNLDRDIGVWLRNEFTAGGMMFRSIGALSQGEGRNRTTPSNRPFGLCYTGRFEWLPLGAFTRGGDYIEGDFEREQSPKISVAGGYSFNQNAWRSAGQLGRELNSRTDIGTFIADALFKYQGLSVAAEYFDRTASNALTYLASDTARRSPKYVVVGTGINVQSTYLFPGDWLVGLRWTQVKPRSDIWAVPNNTVVGSGTYNDTKNRTDFTLAFGKFFQRHDLKIQSDVSMINYDNPASGEFLRRDFLMRFQFEFMF